MLTELSYPDVTPTIVTIPAGNFHARRRWIAFRSVLDLMGVDIRRIQYSWVSAAEGSKWADLVNNTVADIRALGPYTEYQKVADYLREGRDTMEKLRERAAALLAEGTVSLVIGYEEGTKRPRPLFLPEQ